MSEASNQTAASDATNSDPNANKRKLVLFGVLAVVLAMLGYDYRVARPAVDRAYDEIVDHVAAVNKSTTETVSNQDVRSLLGKEPSRTFKDGDYLVEVFSWRSGLPIRTHDLFTVYQLNGDEQLFYRHAKFVYEARGDVSPVPETMLVEPTPLDAAEQDALDARDPTRGADAPDAEPGPGAPGRPELEEESAEEEAKAIGEGEPAAE